MPRVPPKPDGMRNRIYPFLRPPSLLVSHTMNCTVMGYTERCRPFIADLTAQGPRLGKAQMMGMTG